MRVLFVSSVGGHLRELISLLPAFAGHELGLVLNGQVDAPEGFGDRVWHIPHPERSLSFALYFVWAWKIVRRYRPKLVVSAGAGHAVPFALVGRAFGAKVAFLETMAAADRPTLTGRLLYPVADLFMYQWPELDRFYPRGIHVGPIW